MKTIIKQLCALVAVAGLIANCGGASTNAGATGGSTDRTMTGNVAATGGAALVKALANDDCLADEVIATATDATTETASVDEACDFSLSLEIGKSYSIAFLLNDEFVASLIFDTGISGFTGATINVGDGTGDVDLGTITINGNTAFAENDPLDQMDSDDDGESDLDDSDDDGDGIDDEDEEDCDYDGLWDDYDDDECDSEVSDGMARVREVKPRNDPNTDNGNDRVDLDKEVRARIGCIINPDTVTSETFVVQSEDGNHVVDCSYDFNDEMYRVSCEHDADRFEQDTVYMATLSGVECEDGTPVQEVTWYWLSEDEDDGEGCYEDDEDDNDESELEEDDYEDDNECSGDDFETDDSCGAEDDSGDDEDESEDDSDDDSEDDDE